MKFDYVYGQDASEDYPLVSVRIEWITPELATQWLGFNVNNRSMKREPIADAIRNGEWEVNGEAIVFSWDGVLRDGQNRLKGIADAGISVASVVVRGVDPDCQDTIDIGARRIVADFLKMAGYENANLVASSGTAMFRAEQLGIKAVFYKRNSDEQTVRSIVRYIEDNFETDIKPLVKPIQRTMRKYKGISSSTLAPLYHEFKKAGAENFEGFVGQLLGHYPRCKAVSLLDAKLVENMQRKQGKLPQKVVGALIVKAWNAYMQGEEPKVLKFQAGGANPESFPEIFIGWE